MKNLDGIPNDLPPVGVSVVVSSNGNFYLAYRTNDGKWLTTFDKQELSNVQIGGWGKNAKEHRNGDSIKP